jgi:hypothetical protein
MKISDITPKEGLKQLLINAGVTTTIYANNDMPTTGLPNEFIYIVQNGLITSYTKELSYSLSTLSVSLSVKLLSTGATNIVKEKILLGNIESSIHRKSLDDNYFEFDLTNLMSDSRNIVAGYSTKIINIQVKTYKK